MADPLPETPPEPAKVSPPGAPDSSSLFSVVVGVVIVGALYLAREVLVPIMLAVLLAFILAPLVRLMTRLKVGRVPSVLLAVVTALGVFGALAGVVAIQLTHLAADAPRYADAIHKKVNTARSSGIARLPQNFDRISKQLAEASSPTVSPKVSAGAEQSAVSARPVPVEVHQSPPSPIAAARLLLAPFLAPLETTLIVLVVTIFILLQRQDLRDRLIRLFGSDDLHRTTVAIDDAAARLSRYFLAQLAINASFGTVIATGLYFIGVPSPVLWGIVAGLLRFIPYIGAFLAAVPPMLLASAVDPGWAMMLTTAGLFLITEPIMGYGVEPMIYGHSTGLSPLAVIVAAIFWTWLWGPIGLILSTPVTLCMVVLGRHIEPLEFIDVLLGDQPALTPIEGFYQRMLAGDVEEVIGQAELLLKVMSLCSYYDEVAIPGLRLAVADRRRRVLSRSNLTELADASGILLEELSDHDDANPPQNTTERVAEPLSISSEAQKLSAELPPENLPRNSEKRSVLCVAAPGEINAVIASMFLQLLQMHGVSARSGGGPDTSFEPQLICLIYSEITRARSGIKSQVRQLRRTYPGSEIAVGLWLQAGDGSLADHRTAVAADHSFSNLREAILLASPSETRSS